MCVGALSTSRINKGDGPGFSSDVATASLGLFIKIQDDIDSLVLTGISHARRACAMRSIARIYNYMRARACGRFKINNNYQFRIFIPIIQLFKIVPYYSKFYSRIISAGLPPGTKRHICIDIYYIYYTDKIIVLTRWGSLSLAPIILHCIIIIIIYTIYRVLSATLKDCDFPNE